jgi:hypothetical protein
MVIHNAAITGSLTLNGIDISDITGSEVSVAALNAFSSSILSYTASNDVNISALNAQSASFLAYTSSNDTKVSALNSFSSSILSYTSSNNTNISSLQNATSSLQAFSSSILSYTASNDATIASINSYTGSANVKFAALDAASGSAITRLNALEVASGSAINRLSSLETASGSAITRLNALETASGSAISRLNSIESTTGSLNAASGSAITRLNALEVASGSAISRLNSLEVTSGSNITRLTNLENKTGSYATTGSNTFVGGAYFSSSFSPTGFTTTASLYTDGGLRVTRDAYISGTLYLNNVTVFGTQSVAYISSSQLNIGTNIISVNTDTPSVRFGGLAVYDSGSTGLTGSILWDSQNNHWVYSNPSGSSYSGGMFISGPRSAALGSEQGTTNNALMKGQGGDHITSSVVFDVSGSVGIGTSSPAQRLEVSGNATVTGVIYTDAVATRSGTAIDFRDQAAASIMYLDATNKRVGIGTTSPTALLHVVGTSVMLHQYSGSPNTFAWGQYDTSGNASINNLANANLLFATNNTERMRITSGGDVGIGTTSPATALQVNGTARATRINSTGGVVDFDAATGNNFISVSSGNMSIANNGTVNVYVSGSGNVGIGTTSPVTNLHIVRSTNVGLRLNATANNGSAELDLLSNGTQNAFVDYGPNQLRFRSTNSDMSAIISGSVLVLQNDGNIGIGTTSPSYKLDVTGTGRFMGDLDLDTSAANTQRGLIFRDAGTVRWQVYKSTANDFRIYRQGSSNDALVIGTNDAATFSSTVTAGGRYIVSASTSAGITDISYGSLSGGAFINTPSATIGYLAAGGNAALAWDPSNVIFYTNSGNERMRITSGGNVGIGTTSPSAPLEVYNAPGASLFTALRLTNGTGAGGANVQIFLSAASNSGGVRLRAEAPGSNHNDFSLYVTNAGTLQSTPAIFVQGSSNNVGIGTTSPQSFFSLSKSDLIDFQFNASDQATDEKNWVWQAGSPAGTGVYRLRAVNDAYTNGVNAIIFTRSGISSITTTFTGGNVGIGTTSPSYRLHTVSATGVIARFDGSGVAANSATEIDVLGPQSNGELNLGVGGSTFTDSTNNIQNKAFITAASGLSGLNLRSDAGFVQITAGGVAASNEVARFTAGGNVGIGTTSPAYKLDVAGATRTTGNLITGGVLDIYGSTTPASVNDRFALGVNGTSYAWIQSFGSRPIYINNEGNNVIFPNNDTIIGIGTTSPSSKLDISVSSGTTSGFRFKGWSDASTPYLLSLGTQTYQDIFQIKSVNGLVTMGIVGAVGSTPDLAFQTNTTERMRITSAGNVGIGTTNPTAELHVIGSSDTVKFEGSGSNIFTVDGSSGRLFSVDDDLTNSLFSVNTIAGLPVIEAFADNTVKLGKYSAASGSAMTITGSNFVYINAQSNPLPDNAAPQFSIIGGSGTDAIAIKHTQNANNTLNIWQTGTTQHNAIAFYKGDTQANRGNIVVTTSGTSYNTVSDYRLKENITPLENGLDRLMQLKPSKFNWIENGEETEGFIAHELQEYFPYAVSGEKDAVYLSTGNIKAQSVDYGRITPLLVKAIQELKAEIEVLKNR